MADKVRFTQIFNFNNGRAIKLENSSYLEELTGLLSKVASQIDDGSEYFFGNEYYLNNHSMEPNNSYQSFINELNNSIAYGSSEKIYIIRGRAGTGKTLFFEKGFQRFIKLNNGQHNKYIYMGVDFRNIDNNKDVAFYTDKIYRQLCENAIDSIRYLGKEIFDDFNKKYDEFGKDYKTPNTYLFPVKYFCKKITKMYNKPCILIFDNIDLASVKTQKSVFKATVIICNILNKFVRDNDASDCCRIYFAMRPETFLKSDEAKLGEVINFPLPNVLSIFLKKVKQVLENTAQEFDNKEELSCNVTCTNVLDVNGAMISLNSYMDVAKYFSNILDYYLGDIWNNNNYVCDRLGSSEEFHCNIVNYNVRTFLSFLSDTISNGGFKPLTKEFNQKQSSGYYNVFDYIEMIIRGRWIVHPGNNYIDGEGGNKAPIIFNIFDTSLYNNNSKDKVKHFMLYIRILQYFSICGNDQEVCYEDLNKNLKLFFTEEHILNATKKLTYIRMLYSFSEGDEEIGSKQHWREVIVEDTTKFKLSPTGKFYLEKLICEFEYLYQMALSSLMCDNYVQTLKTCWKTEKELTVMCFLKSIFEILKENIDSYKPDELHFFITLFYQVDNSSYYQPFRRMLDSFISVMKIKLQRAKRRETNSSKKLSSILEEATELQIKVDEYFLVRLGD